MIDAILEEGQRKEKGIEILMNVKEQMDQQKLREKEAEEQHDRKDDRVD